MKTSLFSQLQGLLAKGLPVALWRLPGQQHFHLLWQTDTTQQHATARPHEGRVGFVAAPFAQPKEAFFIAQDQHQQEPADRLFAHNTKWSWPDLGAYLPPPEPKVEAVDYAQQVRKALLAFHPDKLIKVVPAQRQALALDTLPDLPQLMAQAHKTFPQAMLSLVAIPGYGLWIGASPEILVEQQAHRLRTVALAGTQVDRGQSKKEVAWREKEIEEQALVSRYIINCFKTIRLREFKEIGPRTVRSGHLFHLQSEFRVDTEAMEFPELASVMLELLHPTSAVCGMPKREALQWLAAHEHFDRRLFAGFLGPMNVGGDSHFYVNLRCLELRPGQALLYAGAGITPDSDPEAEADEVTAKLDAWQRLIRP